MHRNYWWWVKWEGWTNKATSYNQWLRKSLLWETEQPQMQKGWALVPAHYRVSVEAQESHFPYVEGHHFITSRLQVPDRYLCGLNKTQTYTFSLSSSSLELWDEPRYKYLHSSHGPHSSKGHMSPSSTLFLPHLEAEARNNTHLLFPLLTTYIFFSLQALSSLSKGPHVLLSPWKKIMLLCTTHVLPCTPVHRFHCRPPPPAQRSQQGPGRREKEDQEFRKFCT